MPLDKLLIGTRVREIREEVFHETRKNFAERCELTATDVGQIERGEILISLTALDKISFFTGTSVDYLLYGKKNDHQSAMRNSINHYLDSCNDEELKMYFKCISSIKAYIYDNKKKNNNKKKN